MNPIASGASGPMGPASAMTVKNTNVPTSSVSSFVPSTIAASNVRWAERMSSRMAKPGDLAWPLLAAALWGGMYVVSRLTFDTIPPITLGLLRLLVGVAVLALVLRRLPLLRDRRLAGLGALLAGTLMFQFWGTYLAGAASGSLLTLLTPVFVAALAPLVLRESTRRRQWLGIGVALAGATIVSGGAAGSSLLGDLLLVGASLTWGAYTVLGA